MKYKTLFDERPEAANHFIKQPLGWRAILDPDEVVVQPLIAYPGSIHLAGAPLAGRRGKRPR